jgi:hypothetical protein
MREFTHEERLIAARGAAMNTSEAASLRPSTIEMIAEAWAGGELTYAVSNQYAITLACLAFRATSLAADAAGVAEDVMTSAKKIVELQQTTPAISIFTPDEIQAALDKNLAAGLRQLADAIEASAIDGKVIDCRGNGFTGPKVDARAHLLLRIDLAAPIRQVLEGESREEFERDRMGQTGEDNARKMFGDKEKS